jgi:sarcosine oxidase subunit alpha
MPYQDGTNRLAPAGSEIIDRARILNFQFDGEGHHAYGGDTIASALAAAGVTTFSRSFKYHRRRGLLCMSGDCPNCMVQVGGEPNVRACQRRVVRGMQVRSQNAWPSLGFDLMAAVQWFDRFLPPGFYYKGFMRPRWLWPLYEIALRQAAGLGRVPPEPPDRPFDERSVHCEVLVVGGGPAGLAAAEAAAQRGAEVVLLESERDFGGHLRFRGGQLGGREAHLHAARLVDRAFSQPTVRAFSEALAFGWYEGECITAVRGRELIRVFFESVVIATGARERMMGFENNDLPGIMFSGGAQRLLRLYGVRPGRRALVLTWKSNPYALQVADDLAAAGAEVILAGGGPERPDRDPAGNPVAKRFEVLTGTRLRRALGRKRVQGAILFGPESGDERQVDCDLLILAPPLEPRDSLLRQAGGTLNWDANNGRFEATGLPSGAFVVGGARGIHDPETAEAQGRWAGERAAAQLAHGSNPGTFTADSIKVANGDGPLQKVAALPTGGRRGNGKREFVCLCEDVTRADIHYSLEEGYDRLEILKRYSTVGMGPCQGKMCARLMADFVGEWRGDSPGAVGRTTSRPPANPVKLGVLGGRPMNPQRLTPMHPWHEEHGGRLIVAGSWLRPEHYGDPQAEARSVRTGVGLIDVSTLGKILLHGKDAAALLEHLYTNRWQGLKIGRVRYGVMLNEEGVVMDDGVTARLEDDLYYMTTTSGGSERVYEWIQWWLASGLDLEVHALRATDLHAAMNLAGPEARRTLEKVAEEVDLTPEGFPYMHVRQGRVAGAPAILLRIGFTGELSYEVHVPSGFGIQVWKALLDAGREFGIQPFGLEAQRVLRLEKGHIIVGQDTDSLTDPFGAGLEWAVKWDKPAFVGKRSLGRLRSAPSQDRLVGFEVPGMRPPEEGDQVVRPGAGPIGLEIVGRVTSARFSPNLGKVIGLCWVPEGSAGPGSRIQIRSRGEVYAARVTALPFYDPAGERLRS